VPHSSATAGKNGVWRRNKNGIARSSCPDTVDVARLPTATHSEQPQPACLHLCWQDHVQLQTLSTRTAYRHPPRCKSQRNQLLRFTTTLWDHPCFMTCTTRHGQAEQKGLRTSPSTPTTCKQHDSDKPTNSLARSKALTSHACQQESVTITVAIPAVAAPATPQPCCDTAAQTMMPVSMHMIISRAECTQEAEELWVILSMGGVGSKCTAEVQASMEATGIALTSPQNPDKHGP
jgi:hypothetical protein